MLGMVRAYRVVSFAVLIVIAEQPPRIKRHMGDEIKRQFRQDTVAEMRQRILKAWQEEWDIGDKGRQNYAIMSSTEVRISWKHLTADHHMTHLLTGHWPFKT